MNELSKEQSEFLNECEEEFKNRYTEEDEQFMKIKSAVPKKPPIVDPWHNAPQRSNNWSRNNRDRDRRNWQRHDRDRERGREGRDRDRDRERDRERYRDDYRDRNRDYHTGRHHQHRNYRPY